MDPKQIATFTSLLLLVAFTVESQACSNESWHIFKAKFQKTYDNVNHEMDRRAIFCDNLEMIMKHNDRYRHGQETFEMGVNQFADWTRQEFNSWLTGVKDIVKPH